MSLLLLFRPRVSSGVVVVVTGHFDQPTPGGSTYDQPSPSASAFDQPTPGASMFDQPTPS